MKKKKIISTIKILNAGDLLISNWLLSSTFDNGIYDFSSIFEDVKSYVKKSDLAVINLETSYGGNKIPYSAFPKFNTPDEMVVAAKDAGFDVFLTASNHAYDLGYEALIRRIDLLEKNNLEYLGTRKNIKDSFHRIIDVKGIRVGMLNYTRETTFSKLDKVILNAPRDKKSGEREYIVVDKEYCDLISSYNPNYLDCFYDKLKNDIDDLKNLGVDILVAYMHWGKEYSISVRELESKIAKKMNHMGVDVIIGSHPHVVQPVCNYVSKISGKTTLCAYSLGNFVSSMNKNLKVNNVDYVKDGALLELIINKYSDGEVVVKSCNVLPTWVYIDDEKKHCVKVLKKYKNNKFIDNKSYKRTMSLVENGVNKFNKMPKILNQSKSINALIGDKVILEVNALGKFISYRWQYSIDGKNWKTIGRRKRIIVKVDRESDKFKYRCILKNKYGVVYTKKIKINLI